MAASNPQLYCSKLAPAVGRSDHCDPDGGGSWTGHFGSESRRPGRQPVGLCRDGGVVEGDRVGDD